MKASQFANRACVLLEDRGKERDQPDGERSMARCVRTFNAMTGHELSVEDGWLFMVYLKHARMRGGSFRLDDYEDAVSYEALMAEEAIEGWNYGMHDFEPDHQSGIIPTQKMGDDFMVDDEAIASEERKHRLLTNVFLYHGKYTTLADILDVEVNNR